jgi:hypothetical protein
MEIQQDRTVIGRSHTGEAIEQTTMQKCSYSLALALKTVENMG